MNQMSLQDITRNNHGGNVLSGEAYESIKDHASKMRAAVVGYIRSQGANGATSDEVEVALDLPHQTVSARITEAKAIGLLKPVGKRKTRSGRNAAVMCYMVF